MAMIVTNIRSSVGGVEHPPLYLDPMLNFVLHIFNFKGMTQKIVGVCD